MRRALLLCSILLATACASGGAPTTQQGQGFRRDPNVITAEELATANETDLYSAIRRLRPTFFDTRGRASLGNAAPEAIQVYVDGTRAGDVNALSNIRPMEVQEVRKLSATEATQAYGTGHTMGAIVVKRK
jgi:hypothetical protein